MFTGYEPYIAVAICLFCTWMGYKQGRREGIESALEGFITLKILRVLENGTLVAGDNLGKNVKQLKDNG